ncbi:hypothetical protein ACFL1Q_01460 [Patescibacteria group bacterium]
MKAFTKHLPYYLSLLGILFIGLFGFVVFSYDRVFQIVIAVSVAVSYVIWGIIHHIIHKDLHLEVVIEYIVVATLGLIILFSLVFRV